MTTTPKQTHASTDYDSPWKEILERYFPEVMEVFFPISSAGIDRKQAEDFLDTELTWVFGDVQSAGWRVDKLVLASSVKGNTTWIVTHVTVAQENTCFECMYSYDEETQKITYVMSTERRGFKKGLAQGIQESTEAGIQQGGLPGQLQRFCKIIVKILQARFENVPDGLVEAIHAIDDLAVLNQLLRHVVTVGSVEEFMVLLEYQAVVA